MQHWINVGVQHHDLTGMHHEMTVTIILEDIHHVLWVHEEVEKCSLPCDESLQDLLS